METKNIIHIFCIKLYERSTALWSSTLAVLQMDTGCCPRSLAAGMGAGGSPTSCPAGDYVLISSHWTSHIFLWKQIIVDPCKWGVSHLLHTTLWKICQGGIATLMCETWSAFCKVGTAVINEIISLIIRNKSKDFKFTLNSGECNVMWKSWGTLSSTLTLLFYTFSALVAR